MWTIAIAKNVSTMQLVTMESIPLAVNVPLDGVESFVKQVSFDGTEKEALFFNFKFLDQTISIGFYFAILLNFSLCYTSRCG